MTLQIVAPIRNDTAGDGHYDAPRSGARKHKGVDLAMLPGTIILAPATGTVGRYGYAYEDDNSYRIVDFITMGLMRYRFFYACQVGYSEGDMVRKGEPLAIAQDISERYTHNIMTPHVHVEIYNKEGERLNPERILCI